MNRKERRQARRQSGRLPGETLAEAMQRKKKTVEAYAAAAHDETLDMKAEIRVQRVLWMCCVAMNRAFGIGPSRFQQFAGELDKVVAWYEDNKKKGRGDDVYANEMLRREASKCAGIEVNSLYDEEMMEAVAELNRAKTVGDQIRGMTDEELAAELLKYWRLTVDKDGFEDISVNWCNMVCGVNECDEESHLACIRDWLRSPVKQEVLKE